MFHLVNLIFGKNMSSRNIKSNFNILYTLISFLIKEKEFETLITSHDCDAVVIILFLRTDKNVGDRNLDKKTFYARSDRIDVRDPNFHKKNH